MDQNRFDFDQKHRKSRRTMQRKRRGSLFFSTLVGGLIASSLLYILLFYQILPLPEQASPIILDDQEDNVPLETLAASSEDKQSFDQLLKAIVGVIQTRQTNVWQSKEEAGMGSGILYKVDGDVAYVVTNQHVVGDAREVEIELYNKKRTKGIVLGTDRLTDLAVLKIDAKDVEYVAPFGSSEELVVGETVFAIGNPLGLEFSGTVTKGIISGLNRALEVDTTGDGYPDWITEVIQTDAAINPGNSGGALINQEGKVVGINSMKISQYSVEGIGFAIPIDTAMPIIEQIEVNGKVTRPYIGIATAEIHQVPTQYRNKIQLPENVEGGMVIAKVEEGSPAKEAGLETFDLITKINDIPILSILDLRKYLYSEVSFDEAIQIEYYRNGERYLVSLQPVPK